MNNRIFKTLQYVLSFAVVFGAVSTIPNVAHAGPIIRTGEIISVDAGQKLMGDFYGFSPTITISGAAENDVYLGGGTITINAPISQDLSTIGGYVQVHGDVGDDLRVIGGDVTIAKAVHGDVVVLGGTLNILSTATIDGDILFLGGELNIEGVVAGSIHGTAERVRINNEVGGDISLTAKNLFTLGDNAKVLGGITYESNNDIVRAQNAAVTGGIRRTDIPVTSQNSVVSVFILQALVLLFAALTLYVIGGGRMRGIVSRSCEKPGVSGLIGLGVFLVLPLVSLILMVSVIGTLIGIILFALYVLALIFSVILSGIVLGTYAQKFLFKKTAITLMTVTGGVVLLCILGFVPYVGGLLVFACTLISLGGISMVFYRALRP